MADQPSRRWFASQTMDLMIWYDHANRPVSFQLAYDKSSNEHAIVWRCHQGLRHHRVDDGEDNPRANATPILLPANAPDWIAIEQAFCRQSAQLKPDIVQLVRDQLRAGRLAAADLSRWINTLNRRGSDRFYDFVVAGQIVGRVHARHLPFLAKFDDIFQIDAAVRLHQRLSDFAARSDALQHVASAMADVGIIPRVRREPYPVTAGRREQALCTLDRACVGQFGIRAFSQHINGIVRTATGLNMWIGQRAADKPIYPGMLDQCVAGGLPHGISLRDNLVKECAEEAGMDERLALRAQPVGALSYCYDQPHGHRRDIIYCYDLELPEDFQPTPTDGEVADFMLLPIDEVIELVAETDRFKPNCNLVIIDFLLRHGLLGPEHPQYDALALGLRVHP